MYRIITKYKCFVALYSVPQQSTHYILGIKHYIRKRRKKFKYIMPGGLISKQRTHPHKVIYFILKETLRNIYFWSKMTWLSLKRGTQGFTVPSKWTQDVCCVSSITYRYTDPLEQSEQFSAGPWMLYMCTEWVIGILFTVTPAQGTNKNAMLFKYY